MEKSNKKAICIRLESATIERLEQICKSEKRKPSNVIELMIEAYSFTPVKDLAKAKPIIEVEQQTKTVEQPKVIKQIVQPVKKEVKTMIVKEASNREPTMAELLKQSMESMGQ